MADNAPVLQYKPLSTSNHETRFLKLLERRDNGVLRYTLEIGSLSDPPEYIALSYQWYPGGNREKKDSMTIDGIRVPITASLADALWYTSWLSGKLVWADQICINQHDVEERSHQVQQMGRIYASAFMVHVWLGSESHDSDRAVDACRLAYIMSRRKPREVIQLDTQQKDAIAALVRRPYFERVWIIQELAKPDSRKILCGNRAAPWTGLEMALDQMRGHLSPGSQGLMDALTAFRLREREGRLAVPRMLLLQALLDSRSSLATEPKDKVYALLGLTRDGGEVVPAPNYTCSDFNVYIDVARHFVARQGHTAAVLLAARTEDRADLPSWVPNWGRWCSEMPPWVISAVRAERESLNIYRRYRGDRKRVIIPGVQLDTIAGCIDAASVGDLRTYEVDLSIAELERFSMKIAWNGNGRPRVIHRNAKVGDLIYRLENCILPVVLRRVEHEAFMYVGEVHRKDDLESGKFWTDFNTEINESCNMDMIEIL